MARIGGAKERLPVILYLQRISADKILAHVVDCPSDRASVLIVHRRTQTDESFVGKDAQKHAAIAERCGF